ncbi:MAG: hypothetical protein RI940_1020 [Bacteroidota bacterium]|jgi:hypothetical protein
MNKVLFFSVLMIMSFNASFAQKVFETNAAKVQFISIDDRDIDATNNEATSRLEPNGKLSFSMLAKGFHFEMKKMEEHFNDDYIESAKYPKVFFNGQITNFKTINFSKNGSYPVTVVGTMQVHGVNKSIQTNGVIDIVNGLPKASAKFIVRLKEFGMGGLMINMVADKIEVNITASYK